MYRLTQLNIDDLTHLEYVWGTTKHLPNPIDIPPEFYDGNKYTDVIDALFVGGPMPSYEMKINDGFQQDKEGAEKMRKFIMAHIKSFEPKHEDKIAGAGFMMSKIVTIL